MWIGRADRGKKPRVELGKIGDRDAFLSFGRIVLKYVISDGARVLVSEDTYGKRGLNCPTTAASDPLASMLPNEAIGHETRQEESEVKPT